MNTKVQTFAHDKTELVEDVTKVRDMHDALSGSTLSEESKLNSSN